MKTRTELMRNINDMMTFAGHSLTEDQDAVLCAALQTLIPDYFQPRPEINRQLLDALRAALIVIEGALYCGHVLNTNGVEKVQAVRTTIAAAEKEICK